MAVTKEDILYRQESGVPANGVRKKLSGAVGVPAVDVSLRGPGGSGSGAAVDGDNGSAAASVGSGAGVSVREREHERETVSESNADSGSGVSSPSGGQEGFYAQWFKKHSPHKPQTPEDAERERKKQKREAIFSAIGEGISALSNLYYTSRYSPNVDNSNGMAAQTKARFDKLKKAREDNEREYMEGYMRAMKMDADNADKDRAWRHTLEREKVADHYKEAADARAQAKADRDAAMAKLRMDLMQGKIDEQEADAEAARIEADYAEAYWQSRINKNNYRRPIGSGSGGGGKKTSVWKAYNPTTGEEVTIHATDKANAWSQCPKGYQIRQEPVETSVDTEEKNRKGKVKKSTNKTTTKNPSGKTGGVSVSQGGNKESNNKTASTPAVGRGAQKNESKKSGNGNNNYENTKKLGL